MNAEGKFLPISSSDILRVFHLLFRLAFWCAALGAICASALGLSSFLAPDYWLSDNMSFFLWQFLFAGVGGTLLAVLGLFRAHRFQTLYRLTVAVAVVAVLSLAVFFGLRTVENTSAFVQPSSEAQTIKIASINLEALFLGDPVLKAYLEDVDADVLVFQETIWNLQKWQWQRRGLPVGGVENEVYPPNYHVGQLGGLVVFSRFPIEDTSSIVIEGVRKPGANVYHDADREILSLSLLVDGQTVNLVAVHPDSPRTPPRWHNKRAYFDRMDGAIAKLRETASGPIIAVGDWNSSPWSARFHRSLTENGLKTAYPGGIPQPTRYFYDYRLRWIIGAPVDQVAVSEGVGFTGVALGPHIGSDHRPLIVTLELPEPAKN